MYVLAFDRDWTVDVNPPPNREAVPLEWVTYWAQQTDHKVWAIGNQDLVYEAGIPGIVEAVRQYHGNLDVLGEQDGNDRYESWPSRERRLELLAELFPDATGYIVVDDIDLSHVDGWDHYTAWEFLEAIETHPLNSHLYPPPADPGYEWSSGKTSSHSDHVDAIRQQLRTADEIELRVEDDEENVHATSWTKPRPSALPIDAPPTRDFTTTAGETRRIQLPDIIDVTVLEEATETNRNHDALPGPEIDLPNRDTLRGRAKQAEYLTIAQRVEFSIDVLKTATRLPGYAMLLLRNFARTIDAQIIPEDTSSPVKHASTYAAQHPEHLACHVDDLAHLADVSNTDVRSRAIWILITLVEEDPAAAIDAVPALISALGTDETTREYAAYTLACLSDPYPEELLPGLSSLLDQLDTENTTIQTNALAAVGHVVANYPDAAADHVDLIATYLDDDAKRVRNNAAGFLADIAQEHPADVIKHADALTDRLDDPNIQARINASIALLQAGEANPDAVRSHHQQLETALADSSPEVRANACTLIANTDPPVSKEKLRDLRANDPNETVRDRAARALQRLSTE